MVKLIGANNLIKSFPRISNSRERITNSRERIKIKYVHELVIRSLELLIRGNDLIKLFAPISLTIVDV